MAKRGRDSGFDEEEQQPPRPQPAPIEEEDQAPPIFHPQPIEGPELPILPILPPVQPPLGPPPPPPPPPDPQPHPIPDMAQPAQNNAQGGQLAALPTYDGKKDIDIWLEQIDHAQRAFGWNHQTTADAAKTKLVDEGAVWIAGQRRLGNELLSWDDGPADDRLRAALRARFKPTVTALEATDAISDLKQKDAETVSGFYDRVVWAVDVKNSLSWTEEQKQQANYAVVRDGDIRAFFMAGIKREIKEFVIGAGEPPVQVAAMLERARAAEAAFRRRAAAVMSVQNAGGNDGDDDDRGGNGITVAELKKEIDLLKSQIKCYNCDKFGHMRRECPMKGRGRGARRGGRGRRGQGYGGRGRGRGAGGVFIPMANLGQFGYGSYQQGQPGAAPRRQQPRPVYTIAQEFLDDDQAQGNE